MLEAMLFGQFAVRIGGKPVEIVSRPAQALLAFLLLTAGTHHRRERLAALLWPDADEASARQNLRNALWKLNKAIGTNYVQADKLSISFNADADYRLDTASLETAEVISSEALIEAVSRYQGELLPGFYDEWVLLERERLQAVFERRMQALLDKLVEEVRWQDVLAWAERWIALGHVPEPAYRALMIAHHGLGDLAGMASVYRRCLKALDEELDVEPSEETQALYEKLSTKPARKEPLLAPESALQPPAFKEAQAQIFVGREEELSELDTFLEQALGGQGQMVFVTGEAGQGKTSLLGEFARGAQARHSDLVVAFGSCQAYTGIGDPFLPFRDILNMLSGDVEAHWLAGTMSRDHALRLWSLVPHVIEALVHRGPELLDSFVSVSALAERAAAYGQGLRDLLARTMAETGARADRSRLFEAYTEMLEALSKRHPLLLILDDLHWADASSVSLLFHLGRRLGGKRILIVGAYRPEDVPQGLEGVLDEFRRQFGNIWVDLDRRVAAREFIDAFLNAESNRLGEHFRRELARRTEGHPLFTVELVAEMKARGNLERDEEDHWVEVPSLDWEVLPARVEGLIRTRTGHLDSTLKEALAIGSVEGEVFTAEVVAKVLSIDVSLLVRRLGEAARKHRLLEEQGIRRLGARRLSLYRFRHGLFQKYLYSNLGLTDRSYLHEAVGEALETLYADQAEEIAVELARHFQEAGFAEKAIHYLLEAGNRAVHLFANEEAIAHLSRGLELLKELPDTPEKARQELELLLSLGIPLQATRGYADREVGLLYARARRLCERVGDVRQCFLALWNLWAYHTQHAELKTARELGQELLALAEKAGDEALFLQAHHALWFTTLCLGEFAQAREHAQRGIALYDLRHRNHAFHYGGHDPGVCARLFAARALWHLGYPDQAIARSQEALRLAHAFSHPHSLAHAHIFAAEIHLLRREGKRARELAETAIALADKHGFSHWSAWGTILRGCALAEQGQTKEGIAQMRQGLSAYETIGGELERPVFLARLAEAYGKLGNASEGLMVLAEASRAVELSGERRCDAELYRLQGELLGMQGETREAEACLDRALEVARGQDAKSLELRAAMSLCRLQNKPKELLEELYGWFGEGFETRDLREAKALLAALAS